MGPRQHLCAKFHKAVELIGGRWTGAVIRLLLNDRMRFAELRGAIPDISDRMLSERLRELETEGIVARIVVPETPVRVGDELTDKGRARAGALRRRALGREAVADELRRPLPRRRRRSRPPVVPSASGAHLRQRNP
jgi:DNA-binding HxlR family transcriptional regulator